MTCFRKWKWPKWPWPLWPQTRLSWSHPLKIDKNLIQNHQKMGLKTIRRFVPLDTAYRCPRNGVSSTAVCWRVKLATLPPSRFLRLELGCRNVIYQFTNLPLGGLRCFIQVRTEHRAQFSEERFSGKRSTEPVVRVNFFRLATTTNHFERYSVTVVTVCFVVDKTLKIILYYIYII